MRTYRELFGAPEFAPLFATVSLQMAAKTVSGLAVGTLVYAATDSPLLAALSMFGSSFGQVIGAVTLLSAADRLPPRATLAGLAVAFAAGTALLALPGLPVGALLAVILVLGLGASVGGGVRYGLLGEILPPQGYLLGRSVLNMSVGAMQICGFAAGALVMAVLSPRGTLLAGAGLYLAAAVVARAGLRARPPRATGRPSVAATWRANRLLWSSRLRRHVFLALWVPNGLIVGCEALFVPYAAGQAGLLFAAAAAGMLAGDTVLGRFVPPHRRPRLGVPLLLLLAGPYLIFAFGPAPGLAAALAALASMGFAASLVLQERLLALTPGEAHGQALGLHSSGQMGMQAVAATLAGTVAQFTSARAAIVVMAAASAAVTLLLVPGLRSAATRPAGPPVPARPGG
ncbi:membrane protein [Sphaerisporangium rufum]|uniref:Membrane protein n=1 Tax=Sphaerisporangium rufum TaxID=1381558 RepID=A0A919R515_9ACTN|nr:MFS transporter [Sphaerisporangium rufum]GII79253.1 membrane protein [Sphaerisporangium rufum]